MTIRTRRHRGTPGRDFSSYYEARFHPPKHHHEGEFRVRIFDNEPDTPYTPGERERRGAYAVQTDAWNPMTAEGLLDEERELFQALLERLRGSR